MKIAEIMHREVVSLKPGDSIKEAARLMSKSCASSLPVVNDRGAIVGVLTETDVIARLKGRGQPWWQGLFSDARELAVEYQKTTGTRVADVMRPAPTPVHPDLPIETAAQILSEDGVREAPVVENGRLVGEVTRGDLIQVVAQESSRPEEPRTDADLLAEMKTRLERETWAHRHSIWIDVKSGMIALTGLVDSAEERAALSTMARAVAGCNGVENHLLVKSQLPAFRAYA
jgi:CBS domain-containing protein